MNLDETRKVLRFISVAYPNSMKVSDEDTFLMAQIWHRSFADIPYNVVISAVEQYMNTSAAFAPNIGQLKQIIYRPSAEQADPELAWQKVKQVMHKFDWYREEDKKIYNQLPESIKKCLSFDEVYNMAQGSVFDNENYNKPRFMKAYKSIVENEVAEAINNPAIGYEGYKALTHHEE